MSTVVRLVEADKAGFIAHLEDRRQVHLAAARDASSQRNRRAEWGCAEGLAEAIAAIKAWQLPESEEWGLAVDTEAT